MINQPDPYDRFAGEEYLPYEGPLHPRTLELEPEPDSRALGGCEACRAPDDAYVWVSDRWRVRATQRPTGLPVVLGLECRPHLDLGDLPNLLAAELGVMTVRLERAIRSLPGVSRVHVNRWGDDESHLRVWFLAEPAGRTRARGRYLPAWDRALPAVPAAEWHDRLALVGAWLGGFGGRVVVAPRRFDWQPLSGHTAAELTDAAVAGAEVSGDQGTSEGR
jgi:hypothetical protein